MGLLKVYIKKIFLPVNEGNSSFCNILMQDYKAVDGSSFISYQCIVQFIYMQSWGSGIQETYAWANWIFHFALLHC